MSRRKLLRGVCLVFLSMALPWFAFAGDGATLPAAPRSDGLAAAGEARAIEIGAFVGVSPPTAAAVNEFESLSGRHIRSAMWYQAWDASPPPPFPNAELASGVRYHHQYDTHTILHLTWEPWVNLADIAGGVYDSYLISYAGQARDWGEPIRLRFAHEMIQDNVYNNCQGQANCPEWYPWQDQPANYVLAFRHVHDVFMAQGATNVEFVWCPNNYPFQLSVVQPYYPGPDYVDWLCMDGYNSTNRDGQPGWPDWQWFADLFYPMYHTFADNPGVFGDKPVMIGEFASCEAGPYEQPGQTKAAWISDAFAQIAGSAYPKIEAFYWFNINKECDWRINSSPESLAAFQTAIQDDPPFTSHPAYGFSVYLPTVLKK